MSIVINYRSDSNINRAPYHINDEKQAIATDLLATIFQILSESSRRLESKIAEITRIQNLEGHPAPRPLELIANFVLLDYNHVPEQVLVRTTLAEVWSIIDYVHRAGELLPLAKVQIYQAGAELLRRIKLVRNSYHHNSERLEGHFARTGSVFGNLSWQFRDAFNTSFVALYPSMSPNDTTSGNFENRKAGIALTPGISMVNLHFVAKETKKSPVVDEELSIDSIADMVNNVIEWMESGFQESINQADKLQLEHPSARKYSNMPPLITVAIRNNEDIQPE